MEEIGARLRAAREAKGLSLEEVQQALKIRLRYLEAIEAGELGEIPGLVYARGFIRTYARFLEIDITEELAALASPVDAPLTPAEPVPPIAWAEKSATTSAYYVAAGVIAAAIVVLLLARPWAPVTAQGQGTKPPHTTTASKNPKKTKGSGSPPAQPTTTVTDTGSATAVEAGGQTIAGESYTVKPGPLTATLTLDGPCWVEVESDGSFSQFSLSSGVYTYTATSTLQLVLGLPGSITSLSLNGQALGPYSGTTPTAVIAHAG